MSGIELKLVQEAFASNWIAPLGPMVDAFEQEFKEYIGIAHAVALSSGTAAIHLALLNLGVQPGDEIVHSNPAFVAAVTTHGNAILRDECQMRISSLTFTNIRDRVRMSAVSVFLRGLPLE